MHHIIDMSSLLNVNLLSDIASVASLRTRFLPNHKRTCALPCPSLPFLETAAKSAEDTAYVTAYLAWGKLNSNHPLSKTLEQHRMGEPGATWPTVCDAILAELNLDESDFSESDTPFPAHFLSRTMWSHSASQTKARGHVEEALNAQITPNYTAITALLEFMAQHPHDRFSFVNVCIPTHVVHICFLLQSQGLQLFPARDAAQGSRATQPGEYLLHSSCMYGSYPQTFLRSLLVPDESSIYYSRDSKKVNIMKQSRLELHAILVDEHLQEKEPSSWVACP